MSQYKQKLPVLLKPKKVTESTIRMYNGMVELEIGGEQVTVPTAEAFHRLLRQVAVLEQRLALTDEKAKSAARMAKANRDKN
jgi:hypothetical protein